MSKDDTWFLKGIAILLLLYHHIPYDLELGFVLISGARVCVWIFLFISAYGFTLQMQEKYEKEPFRFIIKRILLLYSLTWYFFIFNLIVSIIWDPGLIDYFKSSVFNLPLEMLGLSNTFGKRLIATDWYVNFLIIVIVIFPLLYHLAKRTSWFSIPIVVLITQLIPYKMEFTHGGQLNYYLLIVMLAILFAQKRVFEKLEKFKHKKDFIISVTSLLLMAVLVVVRYILLPHLKEHWYLSIGPVSTAMAMIIILDVYFFRTGGMISQLIQKLGKHAGNIFFSHWFFYNYLVFVLKIQNPFLAYAGCFIYCLSISLLLEFIKKKTDYNNRIRKGIKLLLRED